MTTRLTSVLGAAVLSLSLAASGAAQQTASDSAQSRDSVAATSGPIQDNSFLVEEAYNQDAGTVQHISTFSHPTTGADWTYSFTQEWAVRGQRSQLSATIPLSRVSGDPRAAWGLGDVALNYRYQVAGVDGGPLAVAPRLTVIVPSGRAATGLGTGASGIQAMLPVSLELGRSFVTHLNAGVTRLGRSNASATPATTAFTLGHSLVWLATHRVNLLVESVWTSSQQLDSLGVLRREQQAVVSPGVRWSYDLPHDLQIVPGFAVPLGVGPSAGDRSLFVYLSFEHPY